MKRLKIKSPEFIADDLNAKDFAESLCIFDDCDCLQNKKVKDKVMGILNSILETGRHFKTSVIFTSHNACSGNETKKILNESHTITFFPKTMGGRTMKYLLDNYLGLSKEQIQAVKGFEGRWVTVTKTYPSIIFGEKYAVQRDLI